MLVRDDQCLRVSSAMRPGFHRDITAFAIEHASKSERSNQVEFAIERFQIAPHLVRGVGDEDRQ